MNATYLNTQKVNNASNLCQDPDTKGFDLQAGQSWIYPTNYPIRDYQYNIIQEALHKNTLVSLPTGLGKTFIAAVVMYNFYRWYPHDKIIFMAPTRPLVKQQLDACYDVMAIPQDVTAELTGSKVQQSRTDIWQNKRVFFITPQVLQNDLATIIELGAKIKCLVFDEAHRAKGNHAYCEVIRKLLPKNKLFRVLALSATPGNSSKDVIDVMQNLLIAHVEFRSEDSVDVKPYVFERALETVVVPLGEKLQEIKDQYIQILERYTKILIKYKVIYGNCCNWTKGKIFMVMKEFQARNSGNRSANYSEIMKSLQICVTLYHAYETLIRCGLRAFLNFYAEHIDNPLLRGNLDLRQIIEDLKQYLGPAAEVQPLPDGTFAKIPSSTKFGHPKFYKLRDILISYFQNSSASARVIVFFEYRESVSEAYTLLSQNYPMIRSRVFVGQKSGVTQRDQINTVKAFREGTCNTLLSTSIGEEGLDVGDVDLIVCFDIANKSPIRMIQRMGRTGRKKEGRVVVLVTEGREQQTLKDCLIYKNNLGNFVTNTEHLEPGKYPDNPKMIPSYIKPQCQKMFITVKKSVLGKNSSLKDMLKNMANDGLKFLDEDVEIVEIVERLKVNAPENFWNKEQPLQCDFRECKIDFNKHLEKQRAFQHTGGVKQSKQTEIFVSLMQFADSKRYNLPVTQEISKFSNFSQNKCLKQGDIRDMFAKPNPNILSQESLPSQVFNFEKEKDITQSFPLELFDELSTLLSIKMETKESCNTCDLLFECPKMFDPKNETLDLSTWVQPDLSLLDSITARDLEAFADSLSPKSKEIYKDDLLEIDNEMFEDVTFGDLEQNKSGSYQISRNFDKILDSFRTNRETEKNEVVEDNSFAYQMPKSFGKVLNLLEESVTEDVVETPHRQENHEEILNFFKLSSLEDIFITEDLDKTIIYVQPSPVEQPSPDLFGESPDLFGSPSPNKTTTLPKSTSPILCTYQRVQELKAKKKLFDNKAEPSSRPNLGNLKLARKSFFESTKRRSPNLEISDFCDLSDFGLTGGSDKKNKEKNSDFGLTSSSKKGEEVGDKKKDEKVSDLGHSGSPKKKGGEKKEISKSVVDKKKQGKNSDFGLPSSPKKGEMVNDENKEEKNFDLKLGGSPKRKGGERKEISKHVDLALISSPNKGRVMSDKNKEEKGYDFGLGGTPKEKGEERKEIPKSVVDDLDISDLCDLSGFGLSGPKKIAEVASSSSSPQIEKKASSKDLALEDICEMSDFFGNSVSVVETTKNNNDLDDFFDVSSFLQSPEKTQVIDLTDSPEKKTTTPPSHVTQRKNLQSPSQMSVTQILSLVGKSANQKESNNSWATPKTQKTQKPLLNLSTKKVLHSKPSTNSSKTHQNNISTPKSQKKRINISVVRDSDDEFEDTFSSPIFAKPKPPPSSTDRPKSNKPSTSVGATKKRKKLFCEFIEEEAELSQDEKVEVSDDENEENDDCFEASFVADETQDFNNTTMHAKYLQSVKSPIRGKFKIPQKPKFNITNIFSQEVSNEDNSYLDDSFCVNTEDVGSDDNENDVSELEILEMKLEQMKRNKKRKKSEQESTNQKRRRIVVPDDDSD